MVHKLSNTRDLQNTCSTSVTAVARSGNPASSSVTGLPVRRTEDIFHTGRQLFQGWSVFMSTTDSSLVIETLNGDREAFGRLVEKYERRIFNLAFRICGDYEDAMDVTQTVFVKAFDKLGTFDPSRKFFSWLYRMGVNESLNQIKRQSRIVHVEFDPPSRAPGPEQQIIREESNGLVQTALKRLGEDQRVVIILRHFVDLSYSQIAEVLGIPEKTVKSRLYSARQRMKELLTGAV